jgi:retinol dehydrogenase 12
MKNPISLITGATGGVGKVTALELAKKGFTVVVVARNANKAEALKKEIETSTENTNCDYILADLRSLGQVRRLAETFRLRYPTLDVLINNVEKLQESDQGRIINLSSSVYAIGQFDPGNLQSEEHFSALGTYAATKLFVLMFTEELARRLKGTSVTANAVHPGIVRTPMMLQAPGALRVVSYLSLPFSISPSKGARTSVYLASSPDASGISGQYFTKSKRAAVKNKFDTPENRALLWDLSLRAAGESAATTTDRAS